MPVNYAKMEGGATATSDSESASEEREGKEGGAVPSEGEEQRGVATAAQASSNQNNEDQTVPC